MLGHLSLDIICSLNLTVFLELCSQKTVRVSEQIMSADKYPNIFSRQMKAIVYIIADDSLRKKTLYSHSASLHSMYKWVSVNFNAGGNPLRVGSQYIPGWGSAAWPLKP